jgi:hypothetical protein
MGVGWREALAGAAVLFLTFLVLKLRPRGRAKSVEGRKLSAARRRAASATTSRERADALCEAGRIARDAHRFRLSAAYFLRAMNAEPTDVACVERAITALERRRPRLLEKVLWRRLANLPFDTSHRGALTAAARGLEQLYRHRFRDAAKAEFMRRFSGRDELRG